MTALFVGRRVIVDGTEVVDGVVQPKLIPMTGWLWLVAETHRARWNASPGHTYVRDATPEDGTLPEGRWCVLLKEAQRAA